jgi:arabinofuranosyltransferase
VLAIPLVGLAWAGSANARIVDDGFIYLRVVHQLASGNGPVFNVGERVESFTGPAWLLVLTTLDLVTPFRLEWIAVVTGIGCTVAGTAFAMSGAARLVRRSDRNAFVVPYGAIVLVVLSPMWVYASAGLETGLVFLWLGICMHMLATWATSHPGRITTPQAIVLGLG